MIIRGAEEPNPSHLLLSTSDILIKYFGGLYHTIKTLSTFLSLEKKKKSQLKFPSTIQITTIDFLLLFLTYFLSEKQAPQQDKN